MRLRFLISLLAALACLGMAAKPAVATTVPGDPMATQCYTLSAYGAQFKVFWPQSNKAD